MVTRGLSAKFKASVASFPVRDSRGHEVDFVVDLVSRRIPIEAKSGLTVAGSLSQISSASSIVASTRSAGVAAESARARSCCSLSGVPSASFMLEPCSA